MAIGSVSANTVSTVAGARLAGDAKAKAPGEQPTIADHVAAADEHEPIRSASTTLGTLVDTYL
jgi:hypothetical protein